MNATRKRRTSSQLPTSMTAAEKMRVLIVDDRVMVRQGLLRCSNPIPTLMWWEKREA